MAVVVKECAYALAHVPNFVRYGSKPIRDLGSPCNPDRHLEQQISSHLRSFADAVAYPPNQVFIGNLHPDQLNEVPQPWYANPCQNASSQGPFGEIMPEAQLYAWFKIADDFDLVLLTPEFMELLAKEASAHPLLAEEDCQKLKGGVNLEEIRAKVPQEGALPLYFEGNLVGCVRRDHEVDDTLKAHVLMENLLTKATGALAVRHLLKRASLAPSDIDFLVSCSEEACGDRYNRGGGSMSKAIGELCRCLNASGHDVKAFCAAPIHAIVDAAAMVEAGVFQRVVVVGGGCLGKIGMKYAGHLKKDMPIIEDVLGAMAFLIEKDDGVSPLIRLDVIGKHNIGAASSQQEIMTSLVVKPLEKAGLRMLDIEKYSTELQNPEITMPSGSGNAPLTNYKLMGALAAIRKEIARTDVDKFVRERGMPGYAPTQGHIPAAVPFLGHAMLEMKAGRMKNALFVAKGSLFLGRMSHLSDGLSFLLQANGK